MKGGYIIPILAVLEVFKGADPPTLGYTLHNKYSYRGREGRYRQSNGMLTTEITWSKGGHRVWIHVWPL